MADTSEGGWRETLKDDLQRLYNASVQSRENMVPMICALKLPTDKSDVELELSAMHNHLSGAVALTSICHQNLTPLCELATAMNVFVTVDLGFGVTVGFEGRD